MVYICTSGLKPYLRYLHTGVEKSHGDYLVGLLLFEMKTTEAQKKKKKVSQYNKIRCKQS